MRPRKENHQLGCPTGVRIPVTWLQTDLLTSRRPGGLVGICQNYSRSPDALGYEMRNLGIHWGNSWNYSGSRKAGFHYQSRRGDTYCLMLKSGVLALLKNVLLLYPASQFPAKSCPPIICCQWGHMTPKHYKRKAHMPATSFSS